jgi:hypothetical protein
VLAISRFAYPGDTSVGQAESDLAGILDAFQVCPGLVSSAIGRAMDDPSLWVLMTRWRDVGSYRRALSSYPVKIALYPLSARIVDEPSAYEVLVGPDATKPNEPQPRGGVA